MYILVPFILAMQVTYGDAPPDKSCTATPASVHQRSEHNPSRHMTNKRKSKLLLKYYADNQFSSAIDLYEKLSAQEKANPDNSYVAALSYMHKHDHLAAESLLSTCKNDQFDPGA